MNNIQAEYQVLAGMMNNTNFLYEVLSNAHEEMFTDEENKKLFNKLASRTNKPLKASILMQETVGKEKAHIKTVDGAWIDVEHSDNALHNLKETYLNRQLHYTMNDALKKIGTVPVDSVIAEIETEIGNFYFDDKNENIVPASEYASDAYIRFLDLLGNPDLAKGISFAVYNQNGFHKGFPTLDETFNGAQGGDLIMIAAKTGHGKTAMAITLTRLFSLYQKYAGFYENAEMKLEELTARLLAPIAQVNSKEILYAKLEGAEAEQDAKKTRISDAFEEFRKSKIYLSRIPSLPLHKAKGLARQVKNRYKELDYLVVDYIGRMSIEGQRFNNTWDELYEITKQLKELAMTLNIPIFILAQLNDEGKVEGAKKMKNECDGVLFFQPIEEKDKEYIRSNFRQDKIDKINYKIIKEKVRRDDNNAPIYVNFDKKRQFINEVTL